MKKKFLLSVTALSLSITSQALAGEELLLAIASRDNASVNAHLALRFDLNHVDQQSGKTPLLVATEIGDLGTIKKLVQFGARIDFPSRHTLPLHQAILLHDIKSVQYYINQGASLHQADPRAQTPLACARQALQNSQRFTGGYKIEESQSILRTIQHALQLNPQQAPAEHKE